MAPTQVLVLNLQSYNHQDVCRAQAIAIRRALTLRTPVSLGKSALPRATSGTRGSNSTSTKITMIQEWLSLSMIRTAMWPTLTRRASINPMRPLVLHRYLRIKYLNNYKI